MIRYANVNFLLIFLASEKAKQSFDDSFHFTTDKFSSNDHMQFCKFFVNENMPFRIQRTFFLQILTLIQKFLFLSLYNGQIFCKW